MSIIVIPHHPPDRLILGVRSHPLTFVCFDDGDVYSVCAMGPGERVPGSISVVDFDKGMDIQTFGNPEDQVRVIVKGNSLTDGESKWATEGWVRKRDSWEKADVHILPGREDLFSRHKGLLETSVLAGIRIAIFGLGGGGADIGENLTRCGIDSLVLADNDRLEVGNIVLHAAPISYVGRYKTHAMADVLRAKNPHVNVKTHVLRVGWDTQNQVRQIIRSVHGAVCAADDQEAWKVINKVCVEENKVCIFAGCFSRAYGGRIHFVEPGRTPCYACYLKSLGDDEPDQWIETSSRAESASYADRPVAIEPGLAIDIKPIGLLVVKLLIQYFLRGKETTLRSLDEDLKAPFYMWLNRREVGSRFEQMEPLGFDCGGFHILRWYGLPLERRPDCPVCGNYNKFLAEQYGLDLNQIKSRSLPSVTDSERRQVE